MVEGAKVILFFRYFNKISKKMHYFASFFCFYQRKSNYLERISLISIRFEAT